MVSPAQQASIQASLIPSAVANEVSTSIAAKTLQAQRQQGDALLALLDSASPDPGGVGPGDPLVAKATGLGGLLDVVG